MAGARYFPSIHDNTQENKDIWAYFRPQPKQPYSLNISSTTKLSNKDRNAGASQNSSTTQQIGATAAWPTLGHLAVPDYQPLDVFSVPAEDPGPASWNEEEEMCELLIRLKEIELCDMIGETSGIPQRK